MFRKPQKVQQATEPREEVKERKSRFHIEKLEERMAPRLNDGCLGHFNPLGKCVGRR
jgi:hypothetical protein